jgi:phage I-like protein
MQVKGFAMKTLLSLDNNDALAFVDVEFSADAVEKNADGIPVAWRLLKPGQSIAWKADKELKLEFSDEKFDTIVSNFKSKNVRIPIDSNHAVPALCRFLGTAEDENLIMARLGSNALALGYGDVEKRPDGLWFANVEWSPLGQSILKAKAMKYFSPVIQGLKNQQLLRITSVALTNTPALNDIDSLAASSLDVLNFAQIINHKNSMEENMKDEKTTTAGTDADGKTKTDSAALADPAAAAAKNGADGTAAGTESEKAVLTRVREILGLPAEASAQQLYTVLEGLLEKIASQGGASAEMSDEEKAKRTALIEQGLKSGQFTNAMLEKLEAADSVALETLLKLFPADVPTKRSNARELARNANNADSQELTDSEKAAAEEYGISQDDIKKYNRKEK